ncbi:MAG: hypothetical protein AAFN78_04640 [Pseudomonadota bacterium]
MTTSANIMRRSMSLLPAAALATSLTALAGVAQADEPLGNWSPNGPALRTDGTQVPGGCPIESPAGRFLFTARDPGTGLDIYVNQRAEPGEDFAPGDALPAAINDPNANDFCPTPVRDSQLYFVSNRTADGACGSSDMYRSVNNPATGWEEPQNLGCAPDGPNTPGLDLSPAVIELPWGTFLFYSSDYPTGDQNIYRSRMRDDGTFGPGEMLPAPINTEYDDRQPNVSQDARVIVFASNRPTDDDDTSGFDIFTSERPFLFREWQKVTNLSESVPFDTVEGDETRPSLSWDGRRLYYGSGGVWISERTPAANR